MATTRTSKSVQQLASRISTLRNGTSSRPLPSEVTSLRVRYSGVKNNAGARHWAKEVLPSIRYSNPHVKITVEDPPSTSTKGSEAWKAAPGVFIGTNDASVSEAFFPLEGRSTKLEAKFWEALENPEALKTLRMGGPGAVAPTNPAASSAEPAEPAETVAETLDLGLSASKVA